jgi:hypothetical protein
VPDVKGLGDLPAAEEFVALEGVLPFLDPGAGPYLARAEVEAVREGPGGDAAVDLRAGELHDGADLGDAEPAIAGGGADHSACPRLTRASIAARRTSTASRRDWRSSKRPMG